MIYYEDEVLRALKKGILPKEVFQLFNNAFIAIDTTKDMNLFDIKRLKSTANRNYYRLRKGKYRAIFYTENNNYYVVLIAKREEVYKLWE
jgi:mRNA interferase RelE/StbE